MPKRDSSVTSGATGDNNEREVDRGLDYILSLFGETTRAGDDSYKAACPAHNDQRASLTITRKADNAGRVRTFLDCKSGCSFTDVVNELGLRKIQMFEPGELDAGAAQRRRDSSGGSRGPRTAKAAQVARYPYEGADGRTLYTQVRYEPKDFRTEPVGFSADDRVPFRLPQLIAGVKAGRMVWVVEGEKDVLALESAGEVATCNSGGALAWHSRYARWFSGATVRVVRDKDDAGTKFALSVVATLEGVATSTQVFESRTPQEHSDVSDHLDAGYRLDQLAAVDLDELRQEQAKQDDAEFERDVADTQRRMQVSEEARRRVHSTDRARIPQFETLDQVLSQPFEETQYRIENLWPLGGNVLLAGQYKTGKTTAMLNLLRSLVDGDKFLDHFETQRVEGQVVVLDFEMNRNQGARWLSHAGIAARERITTLFMKGQASAFDVLDGHRRREWSARFRDAGAGTVILDPIGPIIGALGLDEDNRTQVRRLLTLWDECLREGGATESILTHHMGHQGDRAVGATTFLDWPDALWTLVRQRRGKTNETDPTGPVYFAARGRDVECRESQLTYESTARRLSIEYGAGRSEQQRDVQQQVKVQTLDERIRSLVRIVAESGEGKPKSSLEKVVGGDTTITRKAIDQATNSNALRIEIRGQSHTVWLGTEHQKWLMNE